MNITQLIERYRQLVAATNVTQAARDSGVPLRTLMRFIDGGLPSLPTVMALEVWAKGRKLPAGTTDEAEG